MKKLLLLMALSMGILVGCQGNAENQQIEESQADADTLEITTTFFPVYEFTQKIAGDLAEVDILVTQSDVHDYEPSAQDIANIENSDLFIYANPEMETWVPTVVENIESDTVSIVEADENTELIAPQEETTHNHEGEHQADADHDHVHTRDPHTWLDPLTAKEQVMVIRDALIEKDPENEPVYTKNAKALLDDLDQLHLEFEEQLADADNRHFITQHAAFGYIAERYNLTQHSLTGVSSGTEASPQRMAEIVDFIEENNIPVIYYNSSSNSQHAETVAQEANIEAEMLHAMESVEEDILNSEQGYFMLMRENLEALTQSIR